MKKLSGYLLAAILALGVVAGVGVPARATSGLEVMAASCGEPFLGFYPWYYGLDMDKDCSPKAPKDSGDGKGLAGFIWKIVLNIVADLTLAIGYIAIGVTIWGGFWFITSNGDPGKVAKARKVLAAGVSGSLIGILASVIIHAIISVL